MKFIYDYTDKAKLESLTEEQKADLYRRMIKMGSFAIGVVQAADMVGRLTEGSESHLLYQFGIELGIIIEDQAVDKPVFINNPHIPQ